MATTEQAPRKGLLVIGAGLPRTATDSLKEALHILLKEPCYHHFELVRHGGDEAALWDSDNPDFSAIFDHRADGKVYRSGVDFPVGCFVSELMQRYPQALVVLTKRKTADEWAKSVKTTIVPALRGLDRANSFTLTLLPAMASMLRMERGTWIRALGLDLLSSSHEQLVQAYERHNARMIDLIPKERLLVHTAGDGWEPLCNALGLPIPDVPYPRTNSPQDFYPRMKADGEKLLLDALWSWRGVAVASLYAAAGSALVLAGKYALFSW